MSTVATHIQKVRRLLLGTYRPQLNQVDGSHSDSVTTLALAHDPTRQFGAGSYLAINDEIVYVWSVSGSSASVQRGMLGTTPAAHADGDLVEVNPRFPNPLIRDESVAEIASWPNALYRIDTEDYSVGSGDTAVNLSGFTGFLDVLACYRQPTSTESDRWPDAAFTLKRNLPAADFSSGNALFLNEPYVTHATLTISVVAACQFDTSDFTDSADLQSDVGLSAAMEDALKYGVAWRLLVGREVKRTFTEGQGEPRNAAEVPPGHQTQLAESYRRLRNQRIQDEAQRLMRAYGWRMS